MSVVLLAVLGTGRYQTTRYYLSEQPERACETAYAPVATAALTPGVDRVRLLLTPKARAMHEAACRAECERLGLAVDVLDIPRGQTSGEVWRLFEQVLAAAEGADGLALDVTHGFRHLPFVFFGAVTYLTALWDVSVRGITYGALEAGGPEGVPILDLTLLLELVDWYHAVRTFRETGHPGSLARLVGTEARHLFQRLGRPPAVGKLRDALDRLKGALPLGLPLEGGLAASTTVAVIDELERARDRGSLGAVAPTLFGKLREALEELAVGPGQGAGRAEGASKADLRLDRAEIARELQVARWYLERGQADRTVCMLREWMINRWLLANGGAERWLEYHECRLPVERGLNAWAERRKGAEGGGAPVPDLWQQIASVRNRIAHYGFTADKAAVSSQRARQWLERCAALDRDDAAWRPPVTTLTDHVLVAPLGRRLGALFTALVRLQPSVLVVITSAAAKPGLEQASRAARWQGKVREVIEVADAQNCFGEVAAVLERVRPCLLEAGRVSVSLTGGTAAMQYLVERVAGLAGRVGAPTARYAMVDRREEVEQVRNPFVPGECIALEGEG